MFTFHAGPLLSDDAAAFAVYRDVEVGRIGTCAAILPAIFPIGRQSTIGQSYWFIAMTVKVSLSCCAQTQPPVAPAIGSSWTRLGHQGARCS